MTCFGGSEAKLYMVELTVEKLRLTEAVFKENFKDKAPVVKFKLLDFPPFVVTQNSSDPVANVNFYNEIEGVTYSSGKSIIFTRKPRDLVGDMHTQPLKIGIFRPDDSFPTAEGSVPLSGCLCDQIAMVDNDSQHMPKPYELNGVYNLTAPGGDHAGTKITFIS